MSRLVLASLRSRSSSLIAYALSVFLATTMIGGFATLLETGLSGAEGGDQETLVTIASVVGGWGVVIVFFSVASTIGLTVRRRGDELGLLRSIGATPRQARRLVLLESTVVTVLAALLGAVPAWLVGRAVLRLLQNADMVSTAIGASPGVTAISVGAAAITLVSLLAVMVTTRRESRMSVRAAQVAQAAEPPRTSRWRIAAGLLLAVGGLNSAIVTVTLMADSDDPFAAMSTAGPACVLVSVGLATLAPLVLRIAATIAGRVLPWFGVAGHLAAHDVRARGRLLGGVLAPIIVFVGIGAGTIYLVAIDNLASGTAAAAPEGDDIRLLNHVVVGMVSVFAAIMIVNTLAAVIAGRRSEFGRQRLAGATPAQVRAAMLLECGFLALTGIVAGAFAAAATALPYSWVKLDRLFPDVGAGYFVGVAAVALLLALGSGYLLTGRALRPSAIEAAALVTA